MTNINIIKEIKDISVRSLELVILGILIGTVSIIIGLKASHYLYPPKPKNTMIFYGELNGTTVLPMIGKVTSLPFGSDLDVYINSPGGSILALEMLFLAIKANDIHIHSHAVGPALVASAAAIFFVKSDTMDVDPATIFVFHLGSICHVGQECHPMSLNSEDLSEKFMAQSTAELNRVALERCLITKEDYDLILQGEDLTVMGRTVINNMANCGKNSKKDLQKTKDTIPFVHYAPVS